MENNHVKNARVFKAFCDEKRLAIIEMLQRGELCACNILENMPISQPTLSHHMKILCDSGVVVGRREGKWVHYSISPEGSAYAAQLIGELTALSPEAQKEELSCCG